MAELKKVLITGGARFGGGGETLASTEIYAPARDAFTPGPLMATPRLAHSLTLFPDGTVLVVGGLSAD